MVGTQFFVKCVPMTRCGKICRSAAVGVHMLIFEQHKLHISGPDLEMKPSESGMKSELFSLTELNW